MVKKAKTCIIAVLYYPVFFRILVQLLYKATTLYIQAVPLPMKYFVGYLMFTKKFKKNYLHMAMNAYIKTFICILIYVIYR